MSQIIILLVIALLVWAVYRFFFYPKLPAIDYSFGRNDFKNITKWYAAASHAQVEQAVKQLNSDDLTQVCDCIALSLSEKQLMKYHDTAADKNFSSLVLGVFHSHQAWKVRGRGQGITISEDTANEFLSLLKLSLSYLLTLTDNALFGAEANARLIRVYMGLGDIDAAEEHFKKSIAANKEHLWAYIHYAELIQPKWSDESTDIAAFYNHLPDNQVIQTIVKLKLSYDGLMFEMNYFEPSMDIEEYNAELHRYIKELDASNTLFRVPSIHKYIIYAYMFSLASNFEEKQMNQKYWKLLEGRLPLYPFGLQ
jgi:tetratricopeptide (TPR) repeat protein